MNSKGVYEICLCDDLGVFIFRFLFRIIGLYRHDGENLLKLERFPLPSTWSQKWEEPSKHDIGQPSRKLYSQQV